jgi:NAD(P)-dependent dehydrogenase (short-subunit alcohol dehydrogenase family)
MEPAAQFKKEKGTGSGKLKNKTAIITGGDSRIGRAVSVAFAQEGADISIVYLNEHRDAEYTKKQVEKEGRKCILISGDVGDEKFCLNAVEKTIKEFNRLDILVNNAGEIHLRESIEDITKKQLEQTFKTNVFSMFNMTKAALKYLKSGKLYH